MAILFAVVARSCTILAKHAWCGGNFLEDFERSCAFSFLGEVKKRFQTSYSSRAQTALPYAMNSEFSSTLSSQVKHHSSPSSDRLTETHMQVDDLKGIMVRNIDLLAQRGEKLELLIDKTENLLTSLTSSLLQSVSFKTTSRNLARAMCMKNLKLTVVVVVVSLVVLYVVVSAACRVLSWPNFIRK
ncbi:vesicle-associated membrane protein 7-like isoform X2 [Salmo trutta]|uniref:vesicle-associated membrane protein 7-like isoform X2 n=1 Tax=Salmo trutta TaxID=8032 RepID=UPI00113193E5|nr:vesicle-associated membrane protein 7-like isoform X2 [Salmo trutta]